jgi:hypothetical protein
MFLMLHDVIKMSISEEEKLFTLHEKENVLKKVNSPSIEYIPF